MSSNVGVARRTVSYSLHFVWTKVLLDGNVGEIILWTRAQSKENNFSHVTDQLVDTARSSIDNFAQII